MGSGMEVDVLAVSTAVTLWAAAVVSPGPAFAAIVHRSISSSRTTALATVLGITVASGVYGMLTLFGVVVLLGTGGFVSEAVRWLGACYLIWLGIGAWRHASSPAPNDASQPSRSWSQAFLGGLLIEFGNPKGIAFFLSVFAVSIPADATVATKLTTIAGGLLCETAWYSGAALLLGSEASRRVYARARPLVERGFAAVFVGLGAHLLFSRA
jgi:threonine/homoserine/homoserine lactone efflux protein